MVKHPRKSQNRSKATAIATDDTVIDDHNNTPVSTQPADMNLERNSEINLLKQLEDQNLLIKRLENRVKILEGRIAELETNIAVTTTINNNLRVVVDNQEQYSRRLFMVITGMVTLDKDISNDDDQVAIINVIQKETGIQKDTI